MARLLYLPSAQAALDFCSLVGLPLHENSRVVMKAAPISITDSKVAAKMQSASRLDDEFIFASWCKRLERMDEIDWKTSARIDEDGVLIPPGQVFEELILQGGESLSS